MSQVVSANIKTFFTNNDKFSSKFVKILSRERADIVRKHVITVIRADSGEGNIVQDDLADIDILPCTTSNESRQRRPRGGAATEWHPREPPMYPQDRLQRASLFFC